MFTSLTFRTASISVVRRHAHRPPMARAVSQSVRAFSGTSQRQDTGIPPELLERMKDTALYKKLEARPEAIKAVSNMVTVLTDAGFDLSSSRMPSTTQMLKLSMNRKFMKAMKAVVTEMKASGINMNSEEAMHEIMELTKSSKPTEGKPADGSS